MLVPTAKDSAVPVQNIYPKTGKSLPCGKRNILGFGDPAGHM